MRRHVSRPIVQQRGSRFWLSPTEFNNKFVIRHKYVIFLYLVNYLFPCICFVCKCTELSTVTEVH